VKPVIVSDPAAREAGIVVDVLGGASLDRELGDEDSGIGHERDLRPSRGIRDRDRHTVRFIAGLGVVDALASCGRIAARKGFGGRRDLRAVGRNVMSKDGRGRRKQQQCDYRRRSEYSAPGCSN
jgi:hypothetical protein